MGLVPTATGTHGVTMNAKNMPAVITLSALCALVGCGGSETQATSVREIASRAAGERLACVVRPKSNNRDIVVIVGAAAADKVRRSLKANSGQSQVEIRMGRTADTPKRRRAVEEDVRRTQPPLDERVSVAITSAAPTGERPGQTGSRRPMPCGHTRVEITGTTPTPTAYQAWIDGLRKRLPTEVEVVDNTIEG